MVVKKKNKPKLFRVMNFGFMKSVKKRWRKPRGVDNKKRIRAAFAGPCPRVGYKNSPDVRFLHPRGLKDVIVFNVADVIAAGKGVLLRVSGGVGKKKRIEIEKKAEELKLRVANPIGKRPGSKEDKRQVKKEIKKEVAKAKTKVDKETEVKAKPEIKK